MKKLIFNFLVVFCLMSCEEQQSIDTIIGPTDASLPIIKELIQSKTVQRMKNIDQHGVNTHFMGYPTFDRYMHSLDVYAIVKKFGADEKEQVAALLHDVSHTAFSHLGDYLFKVDGYQDSIHDWYLKQTDVQKILKKYNLTIEEINPDQEAFSRLEQPHPGLCADRIAYILRTGLVFGFYTQADINEIVSDLRYEKGEWYFITKKSAKKMALLSLYFAERFWGSPEGMAANNLAAKLLRYCKEKGIITHHMIHFGTDKEIMGMLEKQQDPYIINLLKKLNNIWDFFKVVSKVEPHDLHTPFKNRAVDPLVKTKEGLKRLTQVDYHYKTEKERMNKIAKQGHRIKLI